MQTGAKLLLVTTRQVTRATGEWRLIANRCAVLRSHFSIQTDVICIRTPLDDSRLLESDDWASRVTYFRLRSWVSPQIIALAIFVRNEISRWLESNPRGFVMISGVQLYCLYLGIPCQRLIVDLHGTLSEWRELSGGTLRNRLLKAAYPIASLVERRTLKNARGALVVSRRLAQYAAQCGAQNAWRVPCGVREGSVGSNEDHLRIHWRRRLSVPENATLFVYSGGLSQWQCVREAVQLFRILHRVWPEPSRMLIATPDLDGLKKAVGDLEPDRFLACSIAPDEVQSALFACDVAFLLREDNSTNHNAYPNKFAEYVLAGLFVVTSPGLLDPAEFVERHGLGFLIDPKKVSEERVADWCDPLLVAFNSRGSRSEFTARASGAVLKELTMERLLAPLANDLFEATKGNRLACISDQVYYCDGKTWHTSNGFPLAELIDSTGGQIKLWTFFGRLTDVESVPTGALPVEAPSSVEVRFSGPRFRSRGILGYIRSLPEYLSRVRDCVRDHDVLWLKANFAASWIALPFILGANKLRISHQVGDPGQIVAGPSFLRPFIRLAATLMTRLVHRLSDINVFVSRDLLERFGNKKRPAMLCNESRVRSDWVARSKSLRKDLHNPVRIIYVGRLSPEKGITVLLNAAAALPLDYRLRIVGAGEEKARLENMASGLGIGAQTQFDGAIPWGDKLFALMRESDIFVLPSYTEGLPLVVVEAMSQGLLVVASNVGGIPELVVDGITGLLFPAGDAGALADAISRLVLDSPLQESMRRNAVSVAEANTLDRQLCQMFSGIFSKPPHMVQTKP